MLTDLRGIYCVGLGLLGFGSWAMIGRFIGSGSVVLSGAVLIAAAVLANSINGIRTDSDDAKPE